MIFPRPSFPIKIFSDDLELHTSRVQVMRGTGFPEAEHSSVTSVPFLTTMLPSSGRGFTRGGTAKKYFALHFSNSFFVD